MPCNPRYYDILDGDSLAGLAARHHHRQLAKFLDKKTLTYTALSHADCQPRVSLAMEPCNRASVQPCNCASVQPWQAPFSRAAWPWCSHRYGKKELKRLAKEYKRTEKLIKKNQKVLAKRRAKDEARNNDDLNLSSKLNSSGDQRAKMQAAKIKVAQASEPPAPACTFPPPRTFCCLSVCLSLSLSLSLPLCLCPSVSVSLSRSLRARARVCVCVCVPVFLPLSLPFLLRLNPHNCLHSHAAPIVNSKLPSF